MCVDLARALEDVGAMAPHDSAGIEAAARSEGVQPKGAAQARVVVVGRPVDGESGAAQG
jgi:hypothetical protein